MSRASHCGGVSGCRAQALGLAGLVAARAQWQWDGKWDLPAPGDPCITRRIPNYWTTRESPRSVLKWLRQRSFLPLEKGCLYLPSSSLPSQNLHTFFPLASHTIPPSFLSLPLPTVFVHPPNLVTLKPVSLLTLTSILMNRKATASTTTTQWELVGKSHGESKGKMELHHRENFSSCKTRYSPLSSDFPGVL